MKKLTFTALTLLSLNVQAETLRFENIKLSELVKVTFSEITKTQYFADDSLNNDVQIVTLNIQDKNKAQIHQVMNDLLKASGYDLSMKSGVYYVTKKPQNSQQLHTTELQHAIYEPKHRTVRELTLLLRSAFPNVQTGQQTNMQTQNSQKPTDTIQADSDNQTPITDYIIYRSENAQIASVNDFLELVDKPVKQLQIIGASYEVSNTDDSQRAIDVVGELFKNLTVGVVTGGSNNFLRISGANLSAAFKFLDTDSRFKSISKPNVRVRSGGKVTFNSGQDVPVLGAIVQNNNNTSQSIEYRSSGVLLDVQALALRETIDLKVKQEFSSFVPTKTGINNTPTLNKRLIQTELNMNDNDIVVIGGITDTNTTHNNATFLGLFPIEKQTNQRQSETIIILQVSKI